jgi:formylglycine-generating enzyme required for sulfatase activity
MRAIFHIVSLALLVLNIQAGDVPAPSLMARVEKGIYRPLYRGPAESKEILVDSFWLDIRPVTNGEFLEFVRMHPAWQRSRVKPIFADESYLKHWAGDLQLGSDARADSPVTFISWFAAKAYARWRGKRLPTVAEWEYAAAASPTRPDGEQDAQYMRQVSEWYVRPAPPHLPAVGLGPTNYWGIHDLHGLVWEWTADFSTSMVTGDARGDTGLDRNLFCGAGSQGAKDTGNFPAFMRAGFRSSLRAGYCVGNLGFRCAKDL